MSRDLSEVNRDVASAFVERLDHTSRRCTIVLEELCALVVLERVLGVLLVVVRG